MANRALEQHQQALKKATRVVRRTDGAPEVPPADGGGGDHKSAAEKALAAIVTYIPTEVIGGYVAVAALFTQSKEASKLDTSLQIGIFFFFLALTPILIWLASATKIHGAGQPVPFAPVKWPWWSMIAGTVAFAVWVCALPNSVAGSLLTWFEPQMGAFAVILLAIALPIGDAFADLLRT